MEIIIIIAIAVFVVYQVNNKKEKPIVQINRTEETEIQFFYFSIFNPKRATPFTRENFFVTISDAKITIKGFNRKDIYRIQSSGKSNNHLYFYCLKENGARNRIYFRPDGMMIIFDDFNSENGITLSQEAKEVKNDN